LSDQPRPVLDPIDRLSEIIFGLLMALSFTGTMSTVTGSEGGVNAVLAAALGCNIAYSAARLIGRAKVAVVL